MLTITQPIENETFSTYGAQINIVEGVIHSFKTLIATFDFAHMPSVRLIQAEISQQGDEINHINLSQLATELFEGSQPLTGKLREEMSKTWLSLAKKQPIIKGMR